jgi:hypothetical protein
MVTNLLVHLEHVDFGLLEHSLHLGVAQNLSFICRVLEIVGLDVFPKSLDNLGAGKLQFGD